MKEQEKTIQTVPIGNYIRQVWWPITITLIFQIAALFTNNADLLIIIANLFLIIYIIIKTQIKNYKIAAWINGSIIFIITIIVAVAELIIHFKFYYLFNIFVEPTIYGIGAALLSSGIILMLNKLKIKT